VFFRSRLDAWALNGNNAFFTQPRNFATDLLARENEDDYDKPTLENGLRPNRRRLALLRLSEKVDFFGGRFMSATSNRPIPVGKLVTKTGKLSKAGDKPPSVPLVSAKMPWLAVLLIGGSTLWLGALLLLSVYGVVAESNEKKRAIEIVAERKLLPAVPAPRDIAPDAPAIDELPDLNFVPPQAPLELFDKNLEKAEAPNEAGPLAEFAPKVDVAKFFPPDLAPAPKARDAAVVPCDKLGTRIVFQKNPVDAFKLAKKENKLVYMMHLSGNFEDTAFT
jgi:hypothetical protein